MQAFEKHIVFTKNKFRKNKSMQHTLVALQYEKASIITAFWF